MAPVGGRKAAACAFFFGARPSEATSRLRFCPAAIRSASVFTFSKPLSLNLRMPWRSFASAKSGSTHTLRLRRAFR